MKCRYCNADIEQDAQFCPNCGKNLSKFNKCVKCGELIDNETAFCPHCGAEQPHEEIVEETTSSKKWLWVVICIVILALIGGGVYYFIQRESTNTAAVIQIGDSTNVSTGEEEELLGIEKREEKAFINDFYKNMEGNIGKFQNHNSSSLSRYMVKSAMEKLLVKSDYEEEGDSYFYDTDFFIDGMVSGDQHGDYNAPISRDISWDEGHWYKIYTEFANNNPAPTLIMIKVEKLGDKYMITDVQLNQ